MGCAKGELIRSLVNDAVEASGNVVPIRGHPFVCEARAELLRALAAYCIAECGGCAVTQMFILPPRGQGQHQGSGIPR